MCLAPLARDRIWSGPRFGSIDIEPDPVAPALRGARRANCSMPRGQRRRPQIVAESIPVPTLPREVCRGHHPYLVRRLGRPQEVGHRLRPPPGQRRADQGDAPLRHHDLRALGLGRLAGRACGLPGRHGEHRRLLEAGLPHPGGPVRGDPGQRPARQAGARAARPTSRTPSGSPSCSSTGCSRPASSRRGRSASSAT